MFLLLFLMLILILLFMNKEIFISIYMINELMMNIDFFLNNMNVVFSSVVIIISMMVIMYNKIYFDFNIKLKFKINLLIFILSMIILINSNSMISMLVGWDGLGISSFFLVSFYSNLSSAFSSIITFFFNRLGDSMMMMFFCLYINFSSKINMINFSFIMAMILITGLCTKSSQIPFGVWLPMAMSAPTPISSLVHSSTLVTAGIFILLKMKLMFFMFEINLILIMFSITTFFLGGIFALMMMDIKKTVAFSTLSQLGFIMFSFSMGNYLISFYHLIFHAMFKSLLFINLGFMMIMNYSMQDFRLMNKFSMNIFFKVSMFISVINLMGFFLSCGFMSKDMIMAFFINNMIKITISITVYLSCIMTILYSMKIFFFFFLKVFSMKINMMKKFNMLFLSLMLICIMLIIIPNLLVNLMMLDMELYISNYKKLMIYLMFFFSLLIFKVIFNSLSNMTFYMSSMMMILDMMNFCMKFMMMKINNLFYFMIMMEEMFQLNIFKNMISNYMFNHKMLFLNFNIMLMTMFMMMIL